MTQYSYLVGLVGPGTGRFLGFELHEREADRHGVRYLCRRVNTDTYSSPRRDLGALLRTCRDFGFSGLGIAPSHRRLVVPHVDELSEAAARADSVDVVVFTRDGRTAGHSTDVAGCTAAFARGLPGVPPGRVVQLGAGGTGLAAALALRDRGAEHLAVLDSDLERAEALVARVNKGAGDGWAQAFPLASLAARLRRADGLVHCLPSGSDARGDTALTGALHRDLWIFDLRYRPVPTPLLRAGHALGCRVLHGGGVLVNEAADAFRLVTGLPPHTSHMFADFAELTAGPQAHT
ncbi:shikimate dehydrogenase [Streptomyces ziwulingensis]|uniref:Shikimate dehydrogenase n=1 Tax=Streptomyces ziwulingensis TaxID=1045501 RepID=A0ABP9CM90_9ACTN